MSTSKRINLICILAAVLALAITVLLISGIWSVPSSQTSSMGYESRLFAQGKVHTIDLVVEDWEGFLQNCTNEEYVNCTAVIDGERFANVGLRAKGNTSLSSVASMNSDRYSFKLEFDHYDNTKSYYGLDKLSLNNLIQDNTMMKDYLTYQLMGQMGAAAPLCSYVQINVNNEPWGLYLAVEAIEESFLQRNYGNDYGELYKPDSMGNGAGPGNGKDFNMDQWEKSEQGQQGLSGESLRQALEQQRIDTDLLTGVDWQTATMEDISDQLAQLPGMDIQALSKALSGRNNAGGARGSADVKLQYIDDDPNSYTTIFGNAKTDVTDADKTRLIGALKNLSTGTDLESTLDIEGLLRYFVVHTFVCNGDSYTGSMIHNYYLYEKDGRLSMLPWDYNLAFGGFQSGNVSSVINESIYNPVTGGNLSDRPMVAWIFESEEYTAQYEKLYTQLLQLDLQGLVSQTAELIAPYVAQDPTKFCTTEEFETAVTAMKTFLNLRCESIEGQLAGSTETVDTGDLNLSDMGTMDGGMKSPGNSNFAQGQNGSVQPEMPEGMAPPNGETTQDGQTFQPEMPEGMTPPNGETTQDGQTFQPEMPEGMTPPNGETTQDGQTFQPEMPEGMTPLDGETTQDGQTFQPEMPEGMTPPNGETTQDGQIFQPDMFQGMTPPDGQNRPQMNEGNAGQRPQRPGQLSPDAQSGVTQEAGNRRQDESSFMSTDEAYAANGLPGIIISVLILTAAILFAIFFRRRKRQ